MVARKQNLIKVKFIQKFNTNEHKLVINQGVWHVAREIPGCGPPDSAKRMLVGFGVARLSTWCPGRNHTRQILRWKFNGFRFYGRSNFGFLYWLCIWALTALWRLLMIVTLTACRLWQPFCVQGNAALSASRYRPTESSGVMLGDDCLLLRVSHVTCRCLHCLHNRLRWVTRRRKSIHKWGQWWSNRVLWNRCAIVVPLRQYIKCICVSQITI